MTRRPKRSEMKYVLLTRHALQRAIERLPKLEIPVDALVERAWIYRTGFEFEVEFRDVVFCCKVAKRHVVIVTVKPFKWMNKSWKRNWMIFHTDTCERADQRIEELDVKAWRGSLRSIWMKATTHEERESVSCDVAPSGHTLSHSEV